MDEIETTPQHMLRVKLSKLESRIRILLGGKDMPASYGELSGFAARLLVEVIMVPLQNGLERNGEAFDKSFLRIAHDIAFELSQEFDGPGEMECAYGALMQALAELTSLEGI